MSKVFKKGGIVPRRLGIVVASNKKAQHWLVFGTDVIFDGVTLTSAQPLRWGEALIKIKHGMSAPRKNGTRQHSGFFMGSSWTCESHHDSFSGITGAKFLKKQ